MEEIVDFADMPKKKKIVKKAPNAPASAPAKRTIVFGKVWESEQKKSPQKRDDHKDKTNWT